MNNSSSQLIDQKLSLFAAILINLNVMLGAGIFINTIQLAHHAGALGFLGYLIIGVLMLPLILCIAQLLNRHPSGGFYTFAAREISTQAGFLSAWSYFTGKLASSILMIHVSVGLLQSVVPLMRSANIYALDLIILALFIFCNTMNFRIGTLIQSFFVGFKSIPIVTALIVGALFMKSSNFSYTDFKWEGIPFILPLVLYASAGFEAACSLSCRIKNAEKNASRVVLISFGLVIIIATFYQLFFYGAVGSQLGNLPDYRYAFPALFHQYNFSYSLRSLLTSIFHLAIAFSALGGSYGIIFSNTWNLYILAENKHTFMSARLAQFNRHLIPWACVVIQGFICIIYLLLTGGAQLPLQQLSALGCTLAYTMSVLSLRAAFMKENRPPSAYLIIWGALISCAILISSCIGTLYYQSAQSLLMFAVLLLIGIAMFWTTRKIQQPSR